MSLFSPLVLVTLLFITVAQSSAVAIIDQDLQPLSSLAKRFPPISSSDGNGSGPHVNRVVARSIVIVFLIFIFLIGSLLLLRKCRPTFPRNSRRMIFRSPSIPPPIGPPSYNAYEFSFSHEPQNKRSNRGSIGSDTSTVVVNQLDYLPSPPSLQKPPTTYARGGKVDMPAVGPTDFR